MSAIEDSLRHRIRDIPDFPKPGILFKDITPVLADPKLFRATVDAFAQRFAGEHVDVVVGMESRGFLFGAPLAMELSAAFVPARKPGKLPYRTIAQDYALEYGTARLEIHEDAITRGQKVLIVDDLLATGGTAEATVELVRRLGGTVAAACFVVELSFLDGRRRLPGLPIHSLVTF
jgi:adenine phosphoribosyltransferase